MRLSEAPLLTAEAIRERVAELGAALTRDYAAKELVMVGVLRGAAIFLADLARATRLEVVLDFARARSYAGARSLGEVEILQLPETELEGRHVLLVEDILDTGKTCAALLDRLRAGNPASLKICTLLDKPSRRETSLVPDYCGFEIEDHFVVGYGLDYNQQFRHLPAVYVLQSD